MEGFYETFSVVPQWFWIGLAFFYGSIIGSFLNVCIYRIPRGEEIVKTPSHCTYCQARIPWYLNVPIFSWLVLLGKTKCCGKPLNIRYPFVELLAAAYTTYFAINYGFSLELLWASLFAYIIIVLIMIDAEHMILPNIITLPAIVIGLLFSFFGVGPDILDALAGVFIVAGGFLAIAYLYYKIKKMEGLGMGDIKLVAMIAAFHGLMMTLATTFIASIIGLIYGLFMMITKKFNSQTPFPFGVFLGIAILFLMIFGDYLYAVYIDLSFQFHEMLMGY